MSDQAPAARGGTQEIRFDNGNRAVLVVDDGAGAPELVSRLGLRTDGRRPVVVVCGGADSLTGAALERAGTVLGPAVVAAARVSGAAVVDGGTAAGVMAVLGVARAEQRSALPALIGVAPAGSTTYPGGPVGDERTPLEPHHTHFVLADGAEWGSESGLLFGVAEALAAGGPIAMVLGGGGSVTKAETLEAVRRGWPVFVLAGTGGLADSVVALWQAHRVPRRRRLARLLPRGYRLHRPPASVSTIPDPDLREIVRDGDLRPVRDVEPDVPARQLAWELQDEPVLKQAWNSFATYDQLAARLRRAFARFQTSILVLGILATLLALIHQRWNNRALHWSVVAIPLLASVLIALANRRATGKRWVLLRAAAEAIKTEIYRYRTRTGGYAEQPPPRDGAGARQEMLARQLQAIDARVIHTEASSGPLTPYQGPLPPQMYGASRHDDGLSPLDSGRYLATRIADQLGYYHGRIEKLDRSRNFYQLIATAGAGAGALIAAAGAEIWVGLSTAISVAATAYLANLQLDNTIIAYNQSANKLNGLVREWSAPTANVPDRAAFEDLVAHSEAVLTTELSGWVQQMNDALRQLQENHARPDTEKASTTTPVNVQGQG